MLENIFSSIFSMEEGGKESWKENENMLCYIEHSYHTNQMCTIPVGDYNVLQL